MNHKANAKILFQKGLEAVQPQNLLYEHKLLEDKKITLLGSGKASVEMAKAFMEKNAQQVKKAFVVSNYYEDIEGLDVCVSSHPTPSLRSITSAKRLRETLSSLGEEEVFVYMLSGGTSAMIEEPIEPITMEEFEKTTALLLQTLASIDEINIVRKHLSLVKGGRLGYCTKALGVVFVISDVIGDDLEAIGSAPLYCDSSSCADAKAILLKYDLWKKVSKSIQNVIDVCHHESPKVPNPKIKHTIVASNILCLQAIQKEAFAMGYDAKIITDEISGNVRDVAKKILQNSRDLQSDKPLCLLFGGESTVEVTGRGKGGRNQELCLWVLKELKEDENITFLSAGTDGIDGMSDAAGAVVNRDDLHENINYYLQNNDSYHYHKRYNGAIVTGKSGTNVMDVMMVIKE